MALAARLREVLLGPSRPAFDPNEYWAQRHRAYHDSHKAVGHTGISAEANAEQYAIKRRLLLDAIDRHSGAARGKTLLDAGCGIGLLTDVFANAGFSVVGVDFCESAIERARAAGINAEFVVSPLDQLELGRCFEVVAVIDVLLHVVDEAVWVRTLRALVRHVAAGGLLVIVDWFDGDATELGNHVRPRSIQAYRDILASLECTIVQHDQFRLEHEHATKDILVARSSPTVTT